MSHTDHHRAGDVTHGTHRAGDVTHGPPQSRSASFAMGWIVHVSGFVNPEAKPRIAQALKAIDLSTPF